MFFTSVKTTLLPEAKALVLNLFSENVTYEERQKVEAGLANPRESSSPKVIPRKRTQRREAREPRGLRVDSLFFTVISGMNTA